MSAHCRIQVVLNHWESRVTRLKAAKRESDAHLMTCSQCTENYTCISGQRLEARIVALLAEAYGPSSELRIA